MIVKIWTKDTTWMKRNALRVETINGNTVAHVQIDDASVERLTFGPKNAQMIRFDLSQVAKRLPSDCFNKALMIPATHIVSV